MTSEKRERLMRLSEVQDATGLTRFDIFSTTGFPKPHKRGLKVMGWDRDEIARWCIENRPQGVLSR